MSSVSSNTSGSGAGGRISASDVASSRPASIASISSWLLEAAGAGGGGAGLAGGGATLAAACAAGIADGGMSFITGLAAGAGAAAGFAAGAGAAAFSAAGGLASSSAMIRRIDAKISSIEGSWTFAGWVIADSTSSSTPSHAFYTNTTGFAGSGYAGRDFHRTSLTCPQIKRHQPHRAGARPCSGHRNVAAPGYQGGYRTRARIDLLPLETVRQGNK